MPLAIFDLDDTLLAGDSDRAWGEFLASMGKLPPNFADEAHAAYVDGTIDFDFYTDEILKPVAGMSAEELEPLLERYIRSHVDPLYCTRARELLEMHRGKGDKLVIATATIDLITSRIMPHFEVDTLLATRAEWADGVISGQVTGTPCFQEGKRDTLIDWARAEGESLSGAFFYSDSFNDMPLLEYVDNPRVVNPDQRLRRAAQERDWMIYDFRQNEEVAQPEGNGR